jgi:hypothetical protein
MIPDYRNMESTNRMTITPGITTSFDDYYILDSSLFTCDKLGFFVINGWAAMVYTSTCNWINTHVMINNRTYTYNSKGYDITGDVAADFNLLSLFNKGDTIKVRLTTPVANTIRDARIYCYYIPILLISNEELMNTAIINRPDKWVKGTEYNFGDGLYGQIFTGSFSITTANVGGTLGNLVLADHIHSYGGEMWVDDNDPNTSIIPIGTNNSAISTGYYTCFPLINNYYLKIGYNSAFINTYKYDMWVKYIR